MRVASDAYALPLLRSFIDERRSREIGRVNYDLDNQRAIMDAMFTAFETYYVEATRRFGQGNAEQVLNSCWDAFRQAVGAVLPRFRSPRLAAEREWIATARWQSPVRFQLAGDLLVPALSLQDQSPRAHRLPVERMVVRRAAEVEAACVAGHVR